VISDATKKILRLLINRWSEASRSERDPAEWRAFEHPAAALERALVNPSATHEDIRAAIQVCPGYPNFGRATLRELADAEEHGWNVELTERNDGALKWQVVRHEV